MSSWVDNLIASYSSGHTGGAPIIQNQTARSYTGTVNQRQYLNFSTDPRYATAGSLGRSFGLAPIIQNQNGTSYQGGINQVQSLDIQLDNMAALYSRGGVTMPPIIQNQDGTSYYGGMVNQNQNLALDLDNLWMQGYTGNGQLHPIIQNQNGTAYYGNVNQNQNLHTSLSDLAYRNAPIIQNQDGIAYFDDVNQSAEYVPQYRPQYQFTPQMQGPGSSLPSGQNPAYPPQGPFPPTGAYYPAPYPVPPGHGPFPPIPSRPQIGSQNANSISGNQFTAPYQFNQFIQGDVIQGPGSGFFSPPPQQHRPESYPARPPRQKNPDYSQLMMLMLLMLLLDDDSECDEGSRTRSRHFRGAIYEDPHFEGLEGGKNEKYDVTGEAGKTYSIISDQNLQYNSRFVKASDGNTYLGDLGFKVGTPDSGVTEIKFVQHDDASNQDNVLTLNGKTLADGETQEFDTGLKDSEGRKVLGFVSRHGDETVINTGEYEIHLKDKGEYFNQRVAITELGVQSDGVKPHGLLGQTGDFDGVLRQGTGKQGEGALDGDDSVTVDQYYTLYEVADLLGDPSKANGKFNRFQIAAQLEKRFGVGANT